MFVITSSSSDESMILSNPDVLKNIYTLLLSYQEEKEEDENFDDLIDQIEEAESEYEQKDPDIEAKRKLIKTTGERDGK